MPFYFSLIYLCYACFKRKKSKIMRVFLCFSISSFIFQPQIISSMISLLNCLHLHPEPDKHFLSTNLNIECYTANHLMWVYFMVIPSLFFYSFLLPMISYIMMIKNTHHYYELKNLNAGLKKSKIPWFYFFFESIIILFF